MAATPIALIAPWSKLRFSPFVFFVSFVHFVLKLGLPFPNLCSSAKSVDSTPIRPLLDPVRLCPASMEKNLKLSPTHVPTTCLALRRCRFVLFVCFCENSDSPSHSRPFAVLRPLHALADSFRTSLSSLPLG